MFKKQITKPVGPDRPRRTHKGKAQALVRFDGKEIWADLNPAGRARLVLPEWYSTLRMADGQLKIVKLARDKTASELLLNKMRTEQAYIKAGVAPPQGDGDPEFSELLDRFHADRAKSGCTDVHIQTTRVHLLKAIDDLSIRGLADIRKLTHEDLAKWLDRGVTLRRKKPVPISPGTRRFRAATLRKFLGWLVQHQYIQTIPEFPSISSESVRPRRAMTRAEVDLLEATAPWPRSVLYPLAFSTLARFGALKALRTEDVFLDDPAGPWIKLQRSSSKTKQEQRIPIPTRLVAPLRQLIKEVGENGFLFGGVVKPTQYGDWQNDLKAAGIPLETIDGVAVFHSLRHGGATEMLMKGVDILLVQRMGGWKSVSMLARHYAHLSPVRDRAKIDDVFK